MPDLENLKKQAKLILRWHRTRHYPVAVQLRELLPRFRNVPDAEILAASAPRSTRSSLARLTDLLYDLEPRFEEANYTRAFTYLRHHLHKRSLIVFFTDVIDPLAQAAVMAELGSLARHHLIICVFMSDAAISAALATEPHTVTDAYRANVALGLSSERRVAKAMLERSGAIVIDVPAKALSTALIDEYLRVKRRGLL